MLALETALSLCLPSLLLVWVQKKHSHLPSTQVRKKIVSESMLGYMYTFSVHVHKCVCVHVVYVCMCVCVCVLALYILFTNVSVFPSDPAGSIIGPDFWIEQMEYNASIVYNWTMVCHAFGVVREFVFLYINGH